MGFIGFLVIIVGLVMFFINIGESSQWLMGGLVIVLVGVLFTVYDLTSPTSTHYSFIQTTVPEDYGVKVIKEPGTIVTIRKEVTEALRPGAIGDDGIKHYLVLEEVKEES